jgi:energy-coupling factor transporter transmembrane protein EcfT
MALEARAFSADTVKTSLRQTIMHKRDKRIMIGTVIVSIIIGVISWVL